MIKYLLLVSQVHVVDCKAHQLVSQLRVYEDAVDESNNWKVCEEW